MHMLTLHDRFCIAGSAVMILMYSDGIVH